MEIQKAEGYSFRHKAAAFFKGALRGRNPLMEVALHGLARDGLPEDKRAEYSRMVLSCGYIGPRYSVFGGIMTRVWHAPPGILKTLKEMPDLELDRINGALKAEGDRTIFVFES